MNAQQILIVEDEPFIAQELKLRLEGLGYTVSALVTNGRAAIEQCAESKPDLVLMDIVLEGDMDGVETAQIIHGQFNIPVVYLTAYADDQLLARARITEPFGYILKPYNERELHAIVSIALHNAQIDAQLAQSRQQLLDGLELEVSKRTRQLEIANNDLKHEVAIRKQAESALQLSEERFRCAQIYANIGSWDWNIQSGDLHWSERIAPLFGYAEGELETTYENFLQAVHPDDRQSVIDAVAACIEKGVAYNIEYRIVWPDGTVRWGHESGNVIRAEDGTPLRMMGVVRDITDRKRAEYELIKAKERAEIANRAKSEFLSRMSHELRTPLNAILGFSQLLECDNDCPLVPSQKEHVGHIIKAGWHLLGLINQVLDLSRIESDGLELAVEKIELRPFVEECVSLVAATAQCRSIRIVVNEIKSNPVQFIRGDKTRVRQILLNLLSNAIKFNRQGGDIRVACSAPTEGWVRISVSDTGQGIPQDQLNHLFQPFERLDINKDDVDGTGVGLALVKRLAEVMEGSVGVESVLGQGSTFWFELPGGSEPGANQQVELGVQPVAKPTYLVLYVEDNPANLRLITKILHSHRNDIAVIAAATAEAGFDLVKEREPDLILMDINLPGMDGMQALAHLRRNVLSHEIPIIAVSADVMPSQVAKGMAAGFDRYLTKPIMISALLGVVNEFLPVASK